MFTETLLPVEDVTDRFDSNHRIEVHPTFYPPTQAKLSRAWRIGDCVRATFVYTLWNHGGQPVQNHFDQWYFPRNVGENCELQPVSYETAQKINEKARHALQKAGLVS